MLSNEGALDLSLPKSLKAQNADGLLYMRHENGAYYLDKRKAVSSTSSGDGHTDISGFSKPQLRGEIKPAAVLQTASWIEPHSTTTDAAEPNGLPDPERLHDVSQAEQIPDSKATQSVDEHISASSELSAQGIIPVDISGGMIPSVHNHVGREDILIANYKRSGTTPDQSVSSYLPPIESLSRRTQVFKPLTLKRGAPSFSSPEQDSSTASNLDSAANSGFISTDDRTDTASDSIYSQGYSILTPAVADILAPTSYIDMLLEADISTDEMDDDELMEKGYLNAYPQSPEKEADEPLIPMTVETAQETKDSARSLPMESSQNFWIYKLQPKGPKVEPMRTTVPASDDPHHPVIFMDPVFDVGTEEHLKHLGRPRIGDGNDLTPRVDLLVSIGSKIASLNSSIKEIVPATQDDRKRKLKLSSEQCRLKKRANHEANKVIYAGLEDERNAMSQLITELRRLIDSSSPSAGSVVMEVRAVVDDHMINITPVAGRTGDYVNQMITEMKGPDT